MNYRYHQPTDTTRGHDSLTGCYGPGLHDYLIDEIEFGARVAFALDDPEQWWWELYGPELEELTCPDGWSPPALEGE